MVNGVGRWIYLSNNGNGTFGFGGIMVSGLSTPTESLVMDVNRDGMPDILDFEPNTDGGSWVWLKNFGYGNYGYGGIMVSGLSTPAAAIVAQPGVL